MSGCNKAKVLTALQWLYRLGASVQYREYFCFVTGSLAVIVLR